VRVEGIMARALIRVKSDSFVAVLLSWRGRKLLSRQLSRLKGRLLCLGVLGSVATRPLPQGLWFPIQLTLNVKACYSRVKMEAFSLGFKVKAKIV